MAFEIATYKNGEAKIGFVPVALIVAIIGLLPPVVERWVDQRWEPAEQVLESEKFDLERDQATIDLFREVLSDPDADQRKAMLKFIDASKLLNSDVVSEELLKLDVPQWPAPQEESP